ncbi:MAG: hypothetical protein JXA18_01100 [Chitinispirillaceae bacterium]|nr:hypothetical protein [Chitinispirillaceae bacterium]
MSTSNQLEDFMITDSLPMPWNDLEHSLEISVGYAEGAKKVAAFLENIEERIPLDELFDTLLSSAPPREWFEFLIVCMLDTGFPDIEVAKNVVRLRCLRRLFMKIEGGVSIERREEEVYRRVHSLAEVNSVLDFLGLTFFAYKLVELIIGQVPIHEFHRELLIGLIRLEAQALKIRIDRLSESIDAYNMKKVGRMLPVVMRFDESLHAVEHLADSIEKGVKLGRASMTFADALKVASFEQWVDRMGDGERIGPLKEALLLQHRKLAPTRSVVALMSLYRWAYEANAVNASPAWWAKRALEMYENGRFPQTVIQKDTEKANTSVQKIPLTRHISVPFIAAVIPAGLLIATFLFLVDAVRRPIDGLWAAVSRPEATAAAGAQSENVAEQAASTAEKSFAPSVNVVNTPEESAENETPAAALKKPVVAPVTDPIAQLESMVERGKLSAALKRFTRRRINDGAYFALYARCLYESGEWERAYEMAEASTRIPSRRSSPRSRKEQLMLYKAKYLSVRYDAAPSREAAQAAIEAWWDFHEYFAGIGQSAKTSFAESEITRLSVIFNE